MKKKIEKKRLSAAERVKKPSRQHAETEDLLTDASPAGHSEAPPKEREYLGDRIRQAREMRGLTPSDLSSRTGIPVNTLERVEANEIIPPLGTLIKLGKALEMKMGYFISPGVDKPMTVVRSDRRPMVSRHSQKRSDQCNYFYESLAPEKANRFMEPFIVTLMPTSVEELSNHDGQEFIFVLEGEMMARVGDQVEVLHPGDAVYYDSSYPHVVRCTGSKPTKILAVLYAGSR